MHQASTVLPVCEAVPRQSLEREIIMGNAILCAARVSEALALERSRTELHHRKCSSADYCRFWSQSAHLFTVGDKRFNLVP